jgi:ABC transporter transmembrane region 2
VTGFAAVGVPAAVVNSGLKFMTKTIELAFQQRLDLYLHGQYTRNRCGHGGRGAVGFVINCASWCMRHVFAMSPCCHLAYPAAIASVH